MTADVREASVLTVNNRASFLPGEVLRHPKLKNPPAVPIIRRHTAASAAIPTRAGPAHPIRYSNVDVIERIKSQLTTNPVVLYMKGTPDFPQCGFSAAAVRALGASNAKFEHVNIFEDPELREALKQYSNWPTYPQLYVNGELIGGCDIAVELFESGELQQMLDAASTAAKTQ